MNNKLRFRTDGTFKLMQVTDLHYSDDAECNRRMLALLRELIAAEQPDFIMNTGDTVYGPDAVRQLDEALAPIVESGIPWSFTFGNHDGEYLDNNPELYAHLVSMPGCLLWHDSGSGERVGNHYFKLCNAVGVPEWLIFGLDSGRGFPDARVGGYAAVTRAQIDWYCDRIAHYDDINPDFSALLFQHIALPEYIDLWRHGVTYGMKREGICAPRLNTGFFSALLAAGHTKGVFVGHDHVNDFYGDWYGVTLGYGRYTGFGSYGAQDFLRGCRMFRFHEGDTTRFDTWLRLENGAVVDEPWRHEPHEKREEG